MNNPLIGDPTRVYTHGWEGYDHIAINHLEVPGL